VVDDVASTSTPVKTHVESAPVFSVLKLKYYQLLSSFAINFNLRLCTKEAAAQALNKYIKAGVVPTKDVLTSQFKGVSWDKAPGKWRVTCKGAWVGTYATEEAAAQAYNVAAERIGRVDLSVGSDGIVPTKGVRTSQFKGVSWDKASRKWRVQCNRAWVGTYATEEAAAQAYNVAAERIGRVDLNVIVIPPAGNADGTGSGGNTAAAPAAPAAPAVPVAPVAPAAPAAHATEEAAARAYDNYPQDGVVAVKRREGTSSQFKGVTWVKSNGNWRATCRGKYLGCHATEEAAAQAYDNHVKDGVDPVKHREECTTSQFTGVSWDKSHGKWRAVCKGKDLGYHATEEAAAQAYDNYDMDGVVPVKHREGTSSQFKGVWWDKRRGKWRARAECTLKYLGHHATEEAAAQAYDNYVEDGVDPVTHREGTSSQFKGVSWHNSSGKWKAQCKGKSLGYHTTEEDAARAYNTEAGRIGRVGLNVIPPVGDTDDANNTAAAAALALPRPAAPAHAHAGAGSKRGAPKPPAPRQTKTMRLVTSAGAAGARAAAGTGTG